MDIIAIQVSLLLSLHVNKYILTIFVCFTLKEIAVQLTDQSVKKIVHAIIDNFICVYGN